MRHFLPRAPRAIKHSFSTSARQNGYEDTIINLKIGAHTRVIFQGFTGMVLYISPKSAKSLTNIS